MRIADKMAYEQVNRSITKNRGEMANLQNQAATQKRVTKPSDDPIAAARVLGARQDLKGTEQYIKNLNYAKGFLDYSEQSLGDLSDVLVRAKELALSQANDASSNAQTRRSVAAEIKQLHDHVVQIGNRKLGERFIFGGFRTHRPPFDENGSYGGDEGELKLHVDKDSFLAMNIPGSFVFEGKNLSKDGFNYHSPNQPKTVEELAHLRVERPEAFVPVHDPEVKAEATRDGEVIQSDMPMRGPASLRTTENVATAVNSNSDTVGAVDGINIFGTLKRLEVALLTNDKFGIQDSLDRVDDALQQVIVARSSLGSKVSTIDGTLNAMATNTVDQKQTISQLEDADTFEVISDMNKTESALQASLQTSGKLLQKSLMDFVQI